MELHQPAGVRLDLDTSGGPDGAKVKTKPAVNLEELARIERQMSIFDLSPFMLNQPVMDIRPEAQNQRQYFELYIAVKNLEEKISPEFDITGKSMKGWVMVEPDGIENDEQLRQWIERATRFVRTLAKK